MIASSSPPIVASPTLHDCLFGTKIQGDQFVRLADANCFGDAGKVFKVRRVDGALDYR